VIVEEVRGLIGEPGFGLFGDVRGMIVEDQLDRCVCREQRPTNKSSLGPCARSN
jgi:hypothetical protein